MIVPFAPITGSLNCELVRVVGPREALKRLADLGYEVAYSTPDKFAQLIKGDLAKWQKAIDASGARVD